MLKSEKIENEIYWSVSMPHAITFDTLPGVVDENLATKHDIELRRRDIKEIDRRISEMEI